MAGLKGFSSSDITGATAALTGGAKPKRYIFRNAGIRQLPACKDLALLLERIDDDSHNDRLVMLRMHKDDRNWLTVRKCLLGAKDPAISKHSDAVALLVEKLATTGGLVLSEVKTSSKHHGQVTTTYVVESADTFDIEDHPGIRTFASAKSKGGAPLKVDQIKTLLAKYEQRVSVGQGDVAEEAYGSEEEKITVEPPIPVRSLGEWIGKLNTQCYTRAGLDSNASVVLYKHYYPYDDGGRVEQEPHALLAAILTIDLASAVYYKKLTKPEALCLRTMLLGELARLKGVLEIGSEKPAVSLASRISRSPS